MNGINLTEVVLNQAEKSNKTAYIFNGEQYSYSYIAQNVADMACALNELGVSKRERVILSLNDSPMFIASFLAATAIGAVPIPVNPRLSLQSLAYICSDSMASAILCEPDQADAILGARDLRGTNGRTLNLLLNDLHTTDAVCDSPGGHRASAFVNAGLPIRYARIAEDDDCFWQYTSGTTGNPKGVRHATKGMLWNTEMYAKKILKLESDDTLYSVPKMFFGYGLGNSLFFPLLNNATSLIDDEWPTPQRIVDNIVNYKPSVFFGVPAIYRDLASGDFNLKNSLSSVRTCISAGSTLPEKVYTSWKQIAGLEILDGIGATEMGHIFISNFKEDSVAGSTGKLVPGYEARLEPCGGTVGASRERGVLHIKGESTCLGYNNLPLENEKKFSGGWYRTGDIFEQENGLYFYIGREDDLFKVKGRWVVPIKLETYVQKQFDKVVELALVPEPQQAGSEHDAPVLFVVLDTAAMDGVSIQSYLRSIKDAVAREFDSYMCPRKILQVEEMPRNENGKIVKTMLFSVSSHSNARLVVA